ncbi:hypothetical protein JB92DRAFT_2835005 [Gautieria morchelliformis]|nr:hypothetical protein JB92DRAFT_2835005 [Gautieria morchelliformis]
MAQYLPVLLVSVSAVSAANPAPDDSSLDTQAIGQVDYLSHNWQEEDVAKSWRNMTRRKDSIQNGARLENASWRTWWKQRKKLPTVSPETLNWLKDSDVTWLYGPLHTAADWVPPPRRTPSPERESSGSSSSSVNSSSPSPQSLHPNGARLHSNPSRSNSPWALKPILKHRSISELLSISYSSGPGDSMDLGDDPESAPPNGNLGTSRSRGPRDVNGADEARKRPKLTHTKSDTNIHRRNPFRGDSPPLPLAPNATAPAPLSPDMRPPSSQSRESSSADTNNGQKRHISFNTFVEQCIAIETPETSRDEYFSIDEEDERGVDVRDDMDEYRGYEDESDNEEYESDDDVLEMRPGPHARTYPRRTAALFGTPSSNGSGFTGFDMAGTGSEREHVTIAPIAPTMLKTSASPSPVGSFYHGGGYGSLWEEEEEEEEEALFSTRRPHYTRTNSGIDRTDTVNLVYVPPQGSVYAERMLGADMVSSGYAAGMGGAKAVRVPLSSPPQAVAQLRPSMFDDTELLTSREGADLELPFEPALRLNTGADMGGFEDSLCGSGTSNGVRDPGQARPASPLDLVGRVASDTASPQMEDSRSARSKGSSSSVSEDGTVIPSSLPLSSSPRTAASRLQREAASPSPIPAPSPITPPCPTAAIPILHHAHIHQVPSPAPSSTSTGTSSTTSGGSANSAGSYGSPFLEPPSRGRSTSPITSVSTSGDSPRGRNMRRSSSISLSDVDCTVRDKGDKEPQRGRSRSRSIGPFDGSVSPRSGSHSRLSRRASIDGAGIGLGGLGSAYGLSVSPTWRGQSLSPEDHDGTQKSGRVKSRARRSNKGGESSLSPPSTIREKDIAVIDDSPTAVPQSLSESTGTSDANTRRRIIIEDADASSHSPAPDSCPTAPTAVSTTVTPTPPVSIHIRTSSDESATLVGRAVSSAKGYLGSLWGSQGSDASSTSSHKDT